MPIRPKIKWLLSVLIEFSTEEYNRRYSSHE